MEYVVQDMLLSGGYYAGVTSLKTALGTYSGNPYYTGTLMLFALWECDMSVLSRVQAIMEKSIQRPDASSAHRKRFLDAVLAGTVPPERPELNPMDRFLDAVLRCEAARIAGKPGIAKKAFAKAEKEWEQLGPEYTPRFTIRAMHMRQALDYGDRQRAQSWVIKRLREGYGMLRKLAKEHDLLPPNP
jgi:hypothetical protein